MTEQQQVAQPEDDVATPDVELLQFQKQRSTPKVRLSEVNVDGTELVHCDIDNFEEHVEPDSPYLGMAKAGADEEII